jgi:hypothetical protein
MCQNACVAASGVAVSHPYFCCTAELLQMNNIDELLLALKKRIMKCTRWLSLTVQPGIVCNYIPEGPSSVCRPAEAAEQGEQTASVSMAQRFL